MGPLKSLPVVQETLRKQSGELTEDDIETVARQNAAIRIQRAWRAKKHASYLGTDFLWTDLVTRARFQVDRHAAEEGKNDVHDRWRRAIFLALRLQDGNQMLAQDGPTAYPDAARKYLETQHWLEMIDPKHRYGSNLKHYHRRWQQEDTNENFFRWLDQGEGKQLSLKECPREQLEKERISYLSPSQRLNYLVQIDSEGKLRWAKSGQLVDTTAGMWKDAGNGRGIVSIDRPQRPDIEPRTSFGVPPPESPVSDISDDQLHYILDFNVTSRNKVKRWLWNNLTPRGLMERLLRKTLGKNTWIYVADKNFNIFIGIKTPGTFQHSSFLGGGVVTSAGLISVKDGIIHKLSPLSGHYRTSIQHFRRFLTVLEDRGIDMHKVEISKAEAALWGIEHITKFKKKQARVVELGKQKVGGTLHKIHMVGSRKEHHSADEQKDSPQMHGESNGHPGSPSTRPTSSRSSSGNSSAHSLQEHTDFPADNHGADLQKAENEAHLHA